MAMSKGEEFELPHKNRIKITKREIKSTRHVPRAPRRTGRAEILRNHLRTQTIRSITINCNLFVMQSEPRCPVVGEGGIPFLQTALSPGTANAD